MELESSKALNLPEKNEILNASNIMNLTTTVDNKENIGK